MVIKMRLINCIPYVDTMEDSSLLSLNCREAWALCISSVRFWYVIVVIVSLAANKSVSWEGKGTFLHKNGRLVPSWGHYTKKKNWSANRNSGFQYQIHAKETQNQPFNSLHLLSFIVRALNVVIVATVIVRWFMNSKQTTNIRSCKTINKRV